MPLTIDATTSSPSQLPTSSDKSVQTTVPLLNKYAESMTEPPSVHRHRHDELSDTSGLFIEARSPHLRTNPLQQLWREHLLAQAMLLRGDYDEGRFVLVAPRLNHLVQNAGGAYACQLLEPTDGHARFMNVPLERVIEAIGRAGEPDYAVALYRRYLDWWRVDEVLDAALGLRQPTPASAEPPAAGVSSKPALITAA
jgi:hypothetical protein